MAVDVIIDPGTGQIYWNDQAGSGTQTIAISGNATNAINVVGYSNFFSPGGGGLGTQILATFNDSATSTFTPGTNAYDLGSTSLRWNFYGTGGNFTGAISTSSSTASTSSTTGALIVSGGVGIGGSLYVNDESLFRQTSTSKSALKVLGANRDNNGIFEVTSVDGGSFKITNNFASSYGVMMSLTPSSNTAPYVFGINRADSQNAVGVDVSNMIFTMNRGMALRIYDSTANFYFGLRYTGSGNTTYTWPSTDGSAGQVLYTNGSAGLAWTTQGSSGGGTSGVVAGGQYQIAYYTATGSSVSGSSTFSNDTAAAKVSITHTTASTSTTTGALVVSGGVGIAKTSYFGQDVIIQGTTSSTTTATGALLVFGGLGVSGQVNAASLQTTGNAVISGNLTFNGVGVFGNATSDTINSLARYISDILPSVDNSYDLGNNALGWRNFKVSGVGTIATLQVTSVTSGLWAGTAITLAYGGTNNNLSGIGNSYRVAIYNDSGTAITNISSAGTANSVLFQSSQSVSPTWAGQSQLVVGGASTAANIQGGAAGNIHYQTGANATGFVTNAAGSGASILSQTGSAAPLFLGQSQLVVGGATTAAQWQTSRTVTFATGDVTGSFSINGSADVSNVALTIAANSVALGTDTTGNYAQSVAVSGSGITLGGTAGEGTDFTIYSSGTSANTVSTLVLRDGSGNFSAGTITASLTGTASIATSSINSATTTDTSSTLYLLGSRSSTGFAGTAIYVDSSISILGSQVTAGVWGGTAISAVNGGTGQVSYTIGDILYASSTSALSKLAAGTAGSVLKSNGAGTAPSWQVDATGGGGGSGTVTSGTAGSIAYYTGTGTTVGGSPGFTYTTSGTASTINVFGGSAIGTTIFTVQATSSTSVRVGIGTNLPQYELEIVGELSATNKSFVIDHPTKSGKKLRYGSLEGPENGVYVRGELKGSNIIETPDHWIGLVYPDSFTVTLTPISRFSHLYVEKIEDYKVFIADDCMNPIHCYYTVWAERKDIPKLITEY